MTNNLFDNQNEGIVDKQLLERAIELLKQLKQEGKQQNLSSNYFQQELNINKIQLSNLIEELQTGGWISPSQQSQENIEISLSIGDSVEDTIIQKKQIAEDTNEQEQQEVILQSTNKEGIQDLDNLAKEVNEEDNKDIKNQSIYFRYLNDIENIISSKKEKKIGFFLKEKREEKGFSLEDVAQSTKIPIISLQKIEIQEFSYFNSQSNLINYIGLLNREYQCNLNSFFSNIADSISSSRDNYNITYKVNDFDTLNNIKYNKKIKKSNLIRIFRLYLIPFIIGLLLYSIIFSEQIIIVDSGYIDFNSFLEEKELPIIKLIVPE